MKFSYHSGQSPLQGYVLKRGISQGGFGEVYFGVSEGGKEAALKCIRRNLDVELRGIRPCLNLKHPNLVHLYDLRRDDQGNAWLVMEFVSGQTLDAVLQRHPHGVGPELAIEWFLGIASAVHYLHDHGIVHRDLKPANIFLEHGGIKVGDYGLCKAIGTSQHLAQTQNVGTVHYMAPEISRGEYDRRVDIYAAGAILLEMLTGDPPFDGESAGEILFKHLSALPDLAKAPDAFRPILERALRKDPRERYASIAEMASEVGALRSAGTAPSGPAPGIPPGDAEARRSVPQATTRVAAPTAVPPSPGRELPTEMVLSAAVAAAIAAGWAMLFEGGEWRSVVPAMQIAILGAWSLLLAKLAWKKPRDESWRRRLGLGLLGLALGATAVWLEGYSLADAALAAAAAEGTPRHPFFGAIYPDNRTFPVLGSHAAYFGLMFLLLRWWKDLDREREERFSFPSLGAVLFWAYVLLFLLSGTDERRTAFLSMGAMAAAVQIASPRNEPEPERSKRMRLHGA